MWKNIEGYDGLYRINKNGEMKSYHKEIYNGEYFKGTFEPNHGNRVVLTDRDGETRRTTIARLVAETFLTERRDDFKLKHINGDYSDNSLDNLMIVDKQTTTETKKWDRKPRKIKVIDGEEKTIVNGLPNVVEMFGVKKSGVVDVLKGRQKKHHGLRFEYVNNDDEL